MIDEDLSENADRFRSVSLTSNFWIWEVDANIVFTYCSPTVYEILGYRPEELLGKTPFDLIIPEEMVKFGETFGQIIINRAPLIGLESAIQHKDGRVVVLETNGIPYYNLSGDFMGYRGIDRNITRLKEAEVNLRDERMMLRTLLETIPDLIWLKDPKGIYLTCNPRFERFFGARDVEIAGKSDYDFVPKDLADYFRKKDYEAIEAKKPSVNLEWVKFSDDGHSELLETIKTPMYDSEGNLTGILGIARDITRHKQTEDALKASQSRLTIAMDVARLGIWEFDIATGLFALDDRFYSLFGTSVKEQGTSMSLEAFFKKFIHPDDVRIVDNEIRKAFKADDPSASYQLEHRIIRTDGELRYVVVRFIFQKDELGKTIKFYGVNQDITALKKAEIELRELNFSKDKFFSIIAHDLKNPFNIIIGLSEMLNEEIKSGDASRIEECAGMINNSAVQTLRLLENLLEWAKSQTGKILFNPVPIKLSELFNEEFNVLNDMAAGKNIELRSSVPDNLMIVADKNMIKTILRNLISNAIKFTYKNGKVEVKAVIDEKQVEISVSDSGIGMTKETMAKLFKIDANLTTNGTENEKGTGLGLFLCKEFIEKHGGKIWVESESGKGSIFRFFLPLDVNSV